MSEIVFVTSFRDIDRGTWDTFARTKEMYVKYFLLLAQNISYSLIVYVDKKLGKELKLKCKQKNIIFQDIETVKTFYNKYLTQDQQIMQSQVYQDKIPPFDAYRKGHVEARIIGNLPSTRKETSATQGHSPVCVQNCRTYHSLRFRKCVLSECHREAISI